MMRPARITPSMTARLLRLKSQSRIEAARAPVQAPVPGRGIPTKSNKAQKIPLSPAAFSNFCPPLWPLLRHQLKKASYDWFFLPPQVRIWRAKKRRSEGRGEDFRSLRSGALSIREYHLQWQKGWLRAIQQGEPWRSGR